MKLILCIISLLVGADAVAARSSEYIEQVSPKNSEINSFPGYFDANALKKGAFSVEYTTLSLDYGFSDNFSVGTSLAPTVLGALLQSPAVYLRTRYRFYSNQKVSSAISLYGMGTWVSSNNSSEKLAGSFYAGTSNTSYRINRYNIVDFHLTAMHLGYDYQGAQTILGFNLEESLDLTIVAPGVGYQLYFTDHFGIEAQLLFPVYVNAQIDGSVQSGSVNLLKSKSYLFPYRFAFNWRPSKGFAMGVGIMGAIPVQGNVVWAPSLSFSQTF